DRSACYITNVVKCRPPENRDPRSDEIAACRPYLGGQIRAIDPAVVVTLGNFSSRLLLETDTGITKLRGRSYPFGDRQLVPTFHPAAALRGGAEVMARMRSDLVRAKKLMERVWAH
ncbi:MAG: uracil-DNA glycosylase, partial [Actinobacteria bacterium]|nr:uracil-DNA glycosylase [Actinomycetota bacterium]